MNNALSALRIKALTLSVSNGLALSHRPKKIKLDEDGAVLLPDMTTDSVSGLAVGDEVEVQRHLLVPWHYHLAPFQVDEYGLDTNEYYRINSGDGWREKHFQLLCFVQLFSVIRSKCRIEGLFGILAGEWPGGPQPNICKLFHSDKVLLHWTGALKKREQDGTGILADALAHPTI